MIDKMRHSVSLFAFYCVHLLAANSVSSAMVDAEFFTVPDSTLAPGCELTGSASTTCKLPARPQLSASYSYSSFFVDLN